MSAGPILGHDIALKNFSPGVAESGVSNPPPPPIRPDLFGTEVLHRQNCTSLVIFKHAIALGISKCHCFWVPLSLPFCSQSSACRDNGDRRSYTEKHVLVFNRNNCTVLKNSYLSSAISLAFVCSLICVNCIRNISIIIILVHEK